MSEKILDGEKVADSIKQKIKEDIDNGENYGLGIVLVGDDPASIIYTDIKKKNCEKLGIYCEKKVFSADADEGEIVKVIEEMKKCYTTSMKQLLKH